MTSPISPKRSLWIGLVLLVAALAYVFVPYWLAAKEKPIIEANLWIAGSLGALSMILLFGPGHLVDFIRKWSSARRPS